MISALAFSLLLISQEPRQRPSPAAQDAATVAAIFGEIYGNWELDCDFPGIRDVRIAFDMTIDAKGSIVGQPVLVRPQDSAAYRAAADGARRALLESAPFQVPNGYQGGAYRPTFVVARACPRPDED